jgi:hypothetical protein
MMGEVKKRLDQDKVTTYAKISAKIEALEKKRKKMRDSIIAKLEAGYVCPAAGPYIIELYYQERQYVAWKQQWQRLARKQYGPDWRKVMKRLISSTPVDSIACIKAKVNSRYRVVRDRDDEKVVEFRRKGVA